MVISVLIYGLFICVLIYWVERTAILSANPLNPVKKPAEELEQWLKKFSWNSRHDLKPSQALPQYKFYTEVVELLLQLSRKLGGTYQDSLLFLREGLQSDRQSEKRLRELIRGTWIQMGMMMTLTWVFIFSALAMIEVQVQPFRLSLIALWQSLGLGLLPASLSFFRKRYFSDIGRLWKMLYVLRALERVPLSRSEVMGLAGVSHLKSIQQKNLQHLVEKFMETCQRALQVGGSYTDEVNALMEELRFQEKWHFELFEKRVTVIKLGLLAIFFLPSYLAFIFLLLGDLMTLM